MQSASLKIRRKERDKYASLSFVPRPNLAGNVVKAVKGLYDARDNKNIKSYLQK